MTISDLDKKKLIILNERQWIDIKPYSHNIISLVLRCIAEKYGKDVANKLIKDLKLDCIGWEPEE